MRFLSLGCTLGLTQGRVIASDATDTTRQVQMQVRIDAVVGMNWNQPVNAPKAEPALGNRLGLSVETPGIGVGKAGHLPVSIGLLYTTRAMAFRGDFDRGTLTLVQVPVLGHGPIMGLPWLEAAAGVTPGVTLDWITGSPDKGYHVDNRALGNRISCDITVGVGIRAGATQLRVLLYQSPLSPLRDQELMFSGFLFDWHLPLHRERKPST